MLDKSGNKDVNEGEEKKYGENDEGEGGRLEKFEKEKGEIVEMSKKNVGGIGRYKMCNKKDDREGVEEIDSVEKDGDI